MSDGKFSKNDITYYWKEERGSGSNTRSLHFYQIRQLSKEEIDKIKKEKKEGKKKSKCAKFNCFNKEEGDEGERIDIDLGM